MLCAPLWVDEQRMVTRTLYADQTAAFGGPDIRLDGLFAALAALSLADVQRAEQLREAIISRDLIGQAKRILMKRHKIGAQTGELMGARPASP